MGRLVLRGVLVLAVVLAFLYAGDWVVLHQRISHGTAFRTIPVHQFLATPLKGQKEEYDYDGDLPVTCSRSLFPQAGNLPCWWLSRHTTQWE
ncbi:hypothetical protein [Granulicella arctica]|uniref:hypothetical protein n=1 Tax=Granulicella arctica TaxID=940613 RepID=UPI0021DFC4B7|nr:hypothetical protein [Granulicella arctica]